MLSWDEISEVKRVKYLASVPQKGAGLEEDMKYRENILYEKWFPIRLKGKFDKILIRSAMMYKPSSLSMSSDDVTCLPDQVFKNVNSIMCGRPTMYDFYIFDILMDIIGYLISNFLG